MGSVFRSDGTDGMDGIESKDGELSGGSLAFPIFGMAPVHRDLMIPRTYPLIEYEVSTQAAKYFPNPSGPVGKAAIPFFPVRSLCRGNGDGMASAVQAAPCRLVQRLLLPTARAQPQRPERGHATGRKPEYDWLPSQPRGIITHYALRYKAPLASSSE